MAVVLGDRSDLGVAVSAYLRAPDFLAVLSGITGIPNLLSDPNFFGGGTHENLHDKSSTRVSISILIRPPNRIAG